MSRSHVPLVLFRGARLHTTFAVNVFEGLRYPQCDANDADFKIYSEFGAHK
jgi:hypothetical protein